MGVARPRFFKSLSLPLRVSVTVRPCYGPLFPARAKRAPPSAARASRAKEKGDHNMGACYGYALLEAGAGATRAKR